MKNIKHGLTRKEVIKKTGIPYYTLTHLSLTNKLPILISANGSGSKIIYDPECIPIIISYMIERGLR